MTGRPPVVPAFIDPPGLSAPLEEWLEYRAGLDTIDHPGIERYKREAERGIAEARRRREPLYSR